MGYQNLPKEIKKELSYVYKDSKFVKRPKYSNRSCTCLSKHIHPSILEADYCNVLYYLKRGQKILDFTIQHKIEIIVKGKHITNHYVDFRVVNLNQSVEFHEVKGYETEVWKIKRRLTEALYPKIPYVIKINKRYRP